MKTDLIQLFEDIQKLPQAYDRIKNLPTKDLSEQYGRVTEWKIFGWALGCLLSYTLNQQGYSFEQIQKIILENEQAPFYVSPQTLWREAWIWEHIISQAPHFLRDPYLTKSWYKRMSQHRVPEPIEELRYIALRKQEESEKHKRYSISMWEIERGYEKQPQEVPCAICGCKMDNYYKVCEICKKVGKYTHEKHLHEDSDFSIFIEEGKK